MALLLKFKNVRNERFPISLEMLPLKSMLERSKLVTLRCFLLQVTPIQLQNEVSFDQFLAKVSEFSCALMATREDSSMLDSLRDAAKVNAPKNTRIIASVLMSSGLERERERELLV